MLRLFFCFLIFATATATATATAQTRQPSHCIALSQTIPGAAFVQNAAYGDPLNDQTVRLNYVAHSTFLLETAGGLTLATDFTGFLGTVPLIPDVVTMNHAHESHFTHFPDPAIAHPLKGWGDENGPADHYLDLGEMLIRNVPTDIRGRFDGRIEHSGNSIFVFEVAGLCIGHLGHLHHEPSPEQYAAIGRLDVVMAAVDGGMTLDLPTMIRIIKRLRSSIVIPMHWFSGYALDEFLRGVQDEFTVVRTGGTSLEISLRNLPSRPHVMVMQPGFLRREPE